MLKKLIRLIFHRKQPKFISYDNFCRGLSDSELITLRSLVNPRPGIPSYWPENKMFLWGRIEIMRESVEQELYNRSKVFCGYEKI